MGSPLQAPLSVGLRLVLSFGCRDDSFLPAFCYIPPVSLAFQPLAFAHDVCLRFIPAFLTWNPHCTRDLYKVLLSPANSGLSEASQLLFYSDLNMYLLLLQSYFSPQMYWPTPQYHTVEVVPVSQRRVPSSENTQERKQKFNRVSMPPSLRTLHLHLTEVPDISFSGTSEALDMTYANIIIKSKWETQN